MFDLREKRAVSLLKLGEKQKASPLWTGLWGKRPIRGF